MLFDAGCPPLWSTMPTSGASNRLPELTVLARLLGFELAPHQRHSLAVLTEQRSDGLPAYRDATVTVPRQCGKTTMLMLMALDRMLQWGGPQQLILVAQALGDAVNVWQRGPYQVMVESGLADAAGLKLNVALNDAKLVAANGSAMRFISPSSRSSGHGSTVGLVLYDEAFAATDSRVEQALMPAMRAVRDAQFIVMSTAGDASSHYLKRRVDDGRALVESDRCSAERTAFIEWGASPEADAYDEAVWRTAIPALGHTQHIDDLRHDAQRLPEPDWRRSGLNQWVTASVEPVLNEVGWRAAQRRDVAPEGGIIVGVDCAPDRAHGSLVVCDAAGTAEVVAARAGVEWIVEAATKLVERHPDVLGVALLGGASAASVFIDDFRAAGVPLAVATRSDYVVATGLLVDAVAAGQVRVAATEFFGRLAVAVKGAIKQGRDGFIWARVDVSIDISPLVAFTLAHWAARRGKVETLRAPQVVDLELDSPVDEVELVDA